MRSDRRCQAMGRAQTWRDSNLWDVLDERDTHFDVA